MEQFLAHIDVYGLLSVILSTILVTVVPYLSFRYRKLYLILKACKDAIATLEDACEDKKITEDEAKQIVKSVLSIFKEMKG
jgi:hypothetical protein